MLCHIWRDCPIRPNQVRGAIHLDTSHDGQFSGRYDRAGRGNRLTPICPPPIRSHAAADQDQQQEQDSVEDFRTVCGMLRLFSHEASIL